MGDVKSTIKQIAIEMASVTEDVRESWAHASKDLRILRGEHGAEMEESDEN